MTSRRAALVGRFRASALDRVARIDRLLAGAIEAPDPSAVSEAMGELHTIKGESRMLGFATLSGFTHAIEHGLQGQDGSDQETLHGARHALALLGHALRRELGDEERADRQLEEATRSLGEGLAGFRRVPERMERPPDEPDARDATDDRWTRVEAGRIDRVCDLVDEVAWLVDRLHGGMRDLLQGEADPRAGLRALVEETERSRPRLTELEETAWELRLVPVEPELAELERHGRDIAERAGKPVQILVDAGGAQLERQVLEGLAEPLLHLVRNAVDHGVEPAGERGDKPERATVRITAESMGATVEIAVEDDGRGIPPESVRRAAVVRGLVDDATAAEMPEEQLLQLVFQPGFSTRKDVTEVSGRGVGLDVVRRRVEEVGGTVDVESMEGVGTRFTVSVPAALTRERYLIVEAGPALYGIPARLVRGVSRRDRAAEEKVAGGRSVRDDGHALPLRSFQADLGEADDDRAELVLWMHAGADRWAWTVLRVVGERDLVRRALDPVLQTTGLLSGSSMLEDGRLVLLVRVTELLRRGGMRISPRRGRPTETPTRSAPRVLVVDDSPIIRDLLTELLLNAGLEVDAAEDGTRAVERIDRAMPDLIITDLEMPRMDGFALVEAVRRRDQRVPIVVVTTRGSEEDRRRASELGANAYLVKTAFEGSTLLETVGRFVEVAA